MLRATKLGSSSPTSGATALMTHNYSLILAFGFLELTCVPICARSNTFMVTRARPGTVKRAYAGTDFDHVSYMISVVEPRI